MPSTGIVTCRPITHFAASSEKGSWLCGLNLRLPATKNFRPVRPQIRNTWTRLCLSWPKICYSWTRIRPFWRPKIRYFPDKHKAELQGASGSITPFWVGQKANIIVTLDEITITFCILQNVIGILTLVSILQGPKCWSKFDLGQNLDRILPDSKTKSCSAFAVHKALS